MTVHGDASFKDIIPLTSEHNGEGIKKFLQSTMKLSSDDNVASFSTDNYDRRRLQRKQMSMACLKTLEQNSNSHKNNLKNDKSHAKSLTSFQHYSVSDSKKSTMSLETVIKHSPDHRSSVPNANKVDPNFNETTSELYLKVTCDGLGNVEENAKEGRSPEDDAIGNGETKKRWAVADQVMSCTLIGPLAIACWHGLWRLMDLYPQYFLSWPSAVCGIFLHTCFAILREKFQLQYQDGRATVLRYGLSRIYCWLFLASCISHWRGGWAVWPGLKVEGLISSARMMACLVALGALRCTRCLLTAPFYVQMDTPANSYIFHTRFRKSSREPLLYLLDCLFSVVVVGSLVVFVWRGAWDLMDVYLYPHDLPLSAWISFVIGYGLTIVTFLLQGAAKRTCAKLKGAQRLLVADLYLLLSFVATINVWRSIWSLLDIYFLPDNKELSNWITHGGCFLLLMLLNCANSVLVRGVYIDAEEEGGQCVVFPCYYLRLYFQKEKAKKRLKLLESGPSEKGEGEAPGGEPLLTKSLPNELPVIVKSQNPPQPANHVVVDLPSENENTDDANQSSENAK